jgi:hypothetical protein
VTETGPPGVRQASRGTPQPCGSSRGRILDGGSPGRGAVARAARACETSPAFNL